MKDFLLFKRMLTPALIQVIFWLGVVFCIFVGVNAMTHRGIVHGILTLLIGPMILRVACEIVMLFFRMNSTLIDIKESLRKRP